MSSSVAPQVDVGALSLKGLGALVPLLATLSADDVAPMAILQMDNLGAVFHVSGPYAAQVPDLLQRCKSTRLDRLAVSVGWRKGDTASVMAQSSGGQAIALLCCCLSQVFKEEQVGHILFDCSKTLLANSMKVSSISQLSRVAKLLSQKLDILGFGNFLAQQVTKIYKIYNELGQTVPYGLLEGMTSDGATELFHSLSRAFLEENAVVVRVSGTHSIAYIMAFVLMMFPEQTIVTVEDLIIHEGSRRVIAIECRDLHGPTVIYTETTLHAKDVGNSLIKTDTLTRPPHECKFKWPGWVADLLRIELFESGIPCPGDLLVACCNLIGSFFHDLCRGSIHQLLGPNPRARMRSALEKVFHVDQTDLDGRLESSYAVLVNTLRDLVGPSTTCRCLDDDDILVGWRKGFPPSDCKLHCAWRAIGMALDRGLWSVFIRAEVNATIAPWMNSLATPTLLTTHVPLKLFGRVDDDDNAGDVDLAIFRVLHLMLTDESVFPMTLARCFGSATVYPSLLNTIELDTGQGVSYKLVDGAIFFNERYYKSLDSTWPYLCDRRSSAKGDICALEDKIVPSSVGKHSNLELTIRERSDHLELQTIIQFSGTLHRLHLVEIFANSYGHAITMPCQHDPESPLIEAYRTFVMTTSVAAPLAEGKIAIVQTQRDPTAQLLAFEEGARAIVMKYCCLNCAYEQAKEKYNMIIVT